MPQLRFSHILLLSIGVLCAADWKDKSFPGWSDDTVLRLITDSPLGQAKTVRFSWTKKEEQPFTYKDVPGADHRPPVQDGSPVGGIGPPKSKLPDRADIIIRWASALPVRQASALYQQRDEKKDADKVNDLIAPSSPDYVVEIFGVPAVVAHKGTGSVELVIRDSVYLKTGSGRTIKPSRVEVSLLDLSLKILIHFPRKNPITLTDREVECGGDLQLFGFKERFRLSSMVYQGHLEL